MSNKNNQKCIGLDCEFFDTKTYCSVETGKPVPYCRKSRVLLDSDFGYAIGVGVSDSGELRVIDRVIQARGEVM